MTETKKNPIGQFIENTLVPISTAFAQNRYVRCIGTGSQNLMAIIMIGAGDRNRSLPERRLQCLHELHGRVHGVQCGLRRG